MNRDPQAILGIDLDVSSLTAAVLDPDGESRVLPNADGEDVTPACLHVFDEGEIAIGTDARRMLALDKAHVVDDAVFHLGQADWSFQAHGRTWTAQELVGLLIRKVREEVSELRDTAYHTALFAVPAWFDSARRQAVYEAATIGELHVGSLVNQPIAGALGAGLHLSDDDGSILLVDVGQRDTEVGLINKEGDAISLSGSAVDHRSCVRSYEVRIRRHLIELFQEASHGSLPDDPRLAQQVFDGARQILIALLTRPEAATRLQAQGTSLPVKIHRPTLARLTNDLTDHIEACVDAFLREHQHTDASLTRVALIGPGARIPMIHDRFMARFRRRLQPVQDPERCIARGAALLAALRHAPDHSGLRAPRRTLPGPGDLRPVRRTSATSPPASPHRARLGLADGGGATPESRPSLGQGLRISDATTQTLGLIALDRQRRERVVPIIQRGTSLPCEVKGRFTYAYPGMTAVRVEVTEGQGVLREDVDVVASVELRGLPPRPVGTPIEIIYAYDANQVLKVQVIDVETGTKRDVDISFRGGMSSTEIEHATRRATEIHLS